MQSVSLEKKIAKPGLELIKSFEGFRSRAVPLPDGGWVVGYGHTRAAREGIEITKREAEYLLRYDLRDFEELVSTEVIAPLNQNEFDALVAFAWNIGKDAFLSSDVLYYTNAGQMLAAAESFAAWRKARIRGNLTVVDGLVRRRSAEKNLFLSHPRGLSSAPSAIVRPECDVAASVLALAKGALTTAAHSGGEDPPPPQRDADQIELVPSDDIMGPVGQTCFAAEHDEGPFDMLALRSEATAQNGQSLNDNALPSNDLDMWSCITPTILYVRQPIAV